MARATSKKIKRSNTRPKKKSFHFPLKSLIIVALFFVNIFLLFLVIDGREQPKSEVSADYSIELNELSQSDYSFNDLEDYFEDLAWQKGAAYSYEILRRADLPTNIDLHLLGHVVGDVLYEQEGVEGIKICTHDFRNACSHTIVIGLFLDYGEGALSEIADACRQAPGGKGAYTMCFHGLGHGVLAFAGYDMPRAIELCKRTGTPEYNNREYVECVGGVVMEMMAGVHDPDTWARKSPEYIKEDDPLYPCTADFMTDDVKPICFVYLTPQLFKVAGANLGLPTEDDFEKAFTFCDTLPQSDPNRQICYGAFGKEFVVLAQGRDVRDIGKMSEDKLALIYDWCTLAKDSKGVNACISHAVNSLYWGGENVRDAAVNFCNLIDDPQHSSQCFDDLTSAVNFYIDDVDYYENYCAEVDTSYQTTCRSRLKLDNVNE